MSVSCVRCGMQATILWAAGSCGGAVLQAAVSTICGQRLLQDHRPHQPHGPDHQLSQLHISVFLHVSRFLHVSMFSFNAGRTPMFRSKSEVSCLQPLLIYVKLSAELKWKLVSWFLMSINEIVLLYFCISNWSHIATRLVILLVGATLQKSLRLRRFKSDWDEI